MWLELALLVSMETIVVSMETKCQGSGLLLEERTSRYLAGGHDLVLDNSTEGATGPSHLGTGAERDLESRFMHNHRVTY